jgi:hypothetical protein
MAIAWKFPKGKISYMLWISLKITSDYLIIMYLLTDGGGQIPYVSSALCNSFTQV